MATDENGVEGWKVKEPQIVLEWKAEARAQGWAEGKREGVTEGLARALLHVLERRFQAVPEDIAAAIRACYRDEQLDRWLDAAVTAPSLEQFRQEAGL
jgi:hypothetical protein